MADLEQPELPTRAVLAIQAGRKLEAIRILREETGMSLTEAKALVDRVSGDYRQEMPRLSAGREDSGMLRLVATLVVLGGMAAAFLLLL